MNLPQIYSLILTGKKVLLRADLDVPLQEIKNPDNTKEFKVLDKSRLEVIVPTVKMLLAKGAKHVLIIGHIGKRDLDGNLISTFCLWPTLGELLNENISFWSDVLQFVKDKEPFDPRPEDGKVHLFENLRFYEGEEKDDIEFAKKIASLGDVFVNEAFAASHRQHASIFGLPKLLPHAAGLHFVQEVKNINLVLENTRRPLVIIIGGAKEDKVNYIKNLSGFADKILVGGRLPEYIKGSTMKTLVANLTSDKEDIDERSIQLFEAEIAKAATLVLAGPMGKFEDPLHKEGTEKILQAIANSSAFKLAGGGDTRMAIAKFGLADKFDWISVGGGAMLEFLVNKTLPGIEALTT